jgi:spore coat protein A
VTPLSRRQLLGLAVGGGAAAAVGVPLARGVRGSSSTGRELPSLLPLPAPFTRPLVLPPVLAPRSRGAVDHYEIVQRPATAEILAGVATPVWTYGGTFPGPTLMTRRGRPVVVRHRNELPVPTVVHLHGGHTPAADDGYPTDLVEPVGGPVHGHQHHPSGSAMGGPDPAARVTTGTRDYRYPSDQRAATLWYHDHRMDFTGPSVWRGLAGFHLVTDDEEQALPLPRGDRDLPLMIADRSFAADGSLAYPSLDPSLTMQAGVEAAYVAGVLGDVVTVNGVAWPFAEVDPLRYRLRLLNASNARRYRLALDPPPPGGGGLVQIGTDGGLLHRPLAHDRIEIAPAQRFDVVVDFARYPPGSRVTLVNELGSATTRPVLQLRVGSRRRADDSAVPAVLTEEVLPPASQSPLVRTFHFARGDVGARSGWLINGQPFDPTTSIASPVLGAAEIWRFTSDFHHPVHLHLAHFRVLTRGLGGPGPYDHGWKDTIDLRPAEEVSVAVRFTDHAGRYLLHCHNLEHEDMAMMATFTTTA